MPDPHLIRLKSALTVVARAYDAIAKDGRIELVTPSGEQRWAQGYAECVHVVSLCDAEPLSAQDRQELAGVPRTAWWQVLRARRNLLGT